MKRSVFLSTFLFAAVLSPITLQAYNCAPPLEARLSVLELRVGDFHGENVIEGFDPNVFSYDVRFPESESVGVLWVRTNHPSTKIDVEYDGVPVQLRGQSVAKLDVPLGSSELTIHVTRRGPTPDSNTYVVRIERVPVFACTEQGIREAIAYGGGPNFFDCDGPTHVPTAAEIVIDNDVVLDGEGNMIVDAGGGGAGGAGFAAGEVAPKANGPHRVFSIPEGVTAELIGFTITGGVTAEAGGGILNEGTFSLAASTVTGNHADIGGGIRNFETGTLVVIDSSVIENTALRWGGGIHSRGHADVVDTTVSGNAAELGGGGLTNFTATMTVNGCTVADNSASGILNFGGDLMVTNTAVSGNQSDYDGGGISNVEGGTATLDNTTVSFNSGLYGGGIANREGSMALVGTTVYVNTATGLGGGIFNEAATLTMIHGEVSRNTALSSHGGGILNGGGASATLQNIRVSFNSAFNGGGISNDSLDTTMTLIGATVEENTAINDGGGINNGGTLRLVDSVVAMNTADNIGGGIQSFSGSTELIRTTVSGNAANNGMGGGIQNSVQATLSLTNSTVSGNSADRGGGISSVGTLTLTDSAVSANTATEAGGGLRNEAGGTLVVNRTTVSSNAAGTWTGGIRNYGFAQVIDTTVSNNTAVNGGAGITNRPGGNMTIAGVTVWGNTTPGRTSGIGNAGIMTVTNTTVSANETGEARGAIGNLAAGSMNLVSSTVSGNIGLSGPSALYNEGLMTLRNNIIDGDCEVLAPWESFGGNIESPGNTCDLWHPEDQFFVTPEQLNLGPLQDNGGPTWTHALLPGSVAIDFAEDCVDAEGSPLLTDQRGGPRPQGPACDSGAFELSGGGGPGGESTTWEANTTPAGSNGGPTATGGGCEVFVTALETTINFSVTITLDVASDGANNVTTGWAVEAQQFLLPTLGNAAELGGLTIAAEVTDATGGPIESGLTPAAQGSLIGDFTTGDILSLATPGEITEGSATVTPTGASGSTYNVNWNGEFSLDLTLGGEPLITIDGSDCTFDVQGTGVDIPVP